MAETPDTPEGWDRLPPDERERVQRLVLRSMQRPPTEEMAATTLGPTGLRLQGEALGAVEHPWCQPGDKPEQVFLLKFDDPDIRTRVYEGPQAELHAYADFERMAKGYNCTLFGAMPRLPESQRFSAWPKEGMMRADDMIRHEDIRGGLKRASTLLDEMRSNSTQGDINRGLVKAIADLRRVVVELAKLSGVTDVG